MMLSRRKFLGLTGVAAGSVVAGGLAWRSMVDDSVNRAVDGTATTTPGAGGNRVLVVVQLAGGNDGLNTLVPVDGRYHDARPTLGVPDADLVALSGTTSYGLAPALAALASHWAAGRLVAVDGIGFPDQSRSHFRAMDTWWSATPGTQSPTGWLGRWLDATEATPDPLRAIALGAGSPALVGERSTATVVLDPAGFALQAPKGADADRLTKAFLATSAPLADDPWLAAAQQAVPETTDAVDHLAGAIASAQSAGPESGAGATGTTARKQAGPVTGETFTGLLDVASGVIDLQLGTQVIMVSVSGFDTHTDQATRQPQLLTDLAAGLDRFLTRVQQQGRADDVLVLTTSEFGRRVGENGSGTDHGNGGVVFIAGAGVQGGRVVGAADLDHLVDGDLPSTIDARSAYAAALDWLGGPTDEVLDGSFDRLGLVTA
jgi:uncharacterized protein (DUF1501 family)